MCEFVFCIILFDHKPFTVRLQIYQNKILDYSPFYPFGQGSTNCQIREWAPKTRTDRSELVHQILLVLVRFGPRFLNFSNPGPICFGPWIPAFGIIWYGTVRFKKFKRTDLDAEMDFYYYKFSSRRFSQD